MSTADNVKTLAGMGAIPHEAGVAFRVWAPNADQVHVAGTFNDFNLLNPMIREENGTWYVDVPLAKIGDEYRFLLKNGDLELSRIDPYAREVTNSIGNGIVQDNAYDWEGDEGIEMPPWNEAIIYEMHIGTFNDSASSDTPGTFKSALQKLDHLKRLGVNVIEVMPAEEFAGDYSWGYNPANIFAIESSYGGPKGFKNFVKRCHREGIAVILDVVYNHFGPSDLDLWRFDGWSENDGGGIYFYNDWKAESPWGKTRPDYGRGEVRSYIRDNAISWLEDFHVDGLRWDMTLFIRTVHGDEKNKAEELSEGWSLMQWVNTEVAERFPGALTIAEDLQKNEFITKDAGAGGAAFGSQWGASFVHPVRQVIITPNDADRDMYAISDAIQYGFEGKAVKRVIYTESHDEVANGNARVPSEISPQNGDDWFAQKRSTLGAGLVFTSPGIPMIFQGQEFMEPDWFRDTVPLDWSLNDDFHGIVRLYHDFIWMRRNKGGFSAGLMGDHVHVHHINNQDKLLAMHRWLNGGAGDDVIVLVNFADKSWADYRIGFPYEGTWKVRINSDWNGYSEDFGDFMSYDVNAEPVALDGMNASGTVGIGPYTILVLSQDV